MVKVIKFRDRWSGDNQPWHIIENAKWSAGDSSSLAKYQVNCYCGLIHYMAKKGDRIEEYKEAEHKKLLCQPCVKMINLQIRQARTRTLKTESEPKSDLCSDSVFKI